MIEVYPPKPKSKYWQTSYGAEIPKEIVRWEWSYTFNCWGAVVIFEDGTRVFTYPAWWMVTNEERAK